MKIDGTTSRESQCPIAYAMELVGSKWKLPILWKLMEQDGLHYNELKRCVPGISNTMLTKCLREMEEAELITRFSYDTIPPSVTYHLAEQGRLLNDSLTALYHWGQQHRARGERMQSGAGE